MYAHAELKRAFIDRLAARVEQLRVGDPTPADTEVGPLIRPDETGRKLDRGSRGGGCAADRRRTPQRNHAQAHDPSRSASWSEAFDARDFRAGSCIYGCNDIDEAIAAANSLPVAFQGSIFMRGLEVPFDAAERLDASAGMVNDHSAFRADWMPFAARRDRHYGSRGILCAARGMIAEKMFIFKRHCGPCFIKKTPCFARLIGLEHTPASQA
jgi:acyl-CoA reductase-like NAD-dependent aldehyde dehydrogenase